MPAEVPVLSVEQGFAAVQRDGWGEALKPRATLREGDVVATGGKPLKLRMHRNGSLRLGQETMLRVQKLPFSSYAKELGTVFELQSGYLQVVWKRPGAKAGWPLAVQLGGTLFELDRGDYFFDAAGVAQRLCAADGALRWSEAGTMHELRAPACREFLEDESRDLQLPQGGSEFFIEVRQRMRLPELPVQPASSRSVQPVAAPVAVAASPATAVAVVEAPALPASSGAPGSAGWVINVSSVSDRPTAEREAAGLRAAGYEPVIETAQVQGKLWYRLKIEGAASAEEARALGKRIERQMGIAGVWIAPR